MDEDNLLDLQEISIENEEWSFYLNETEYGLYPTEAAPASEVFSVRIRWKSFDERETCGVYGVIKIEDEYGNSYEIYCRESDEPETLTRKHATLSLDMMPECAISNPWAFMTIRLFDSLDHGVIVDKVLDLDKVTKKDDYDRVKFREVDGAGCNVSVSYGALSTALVAFVKITLIKNDKSDGLFTAADLYGRIVARYGNTYGQKYPEIVLFNEPSHQPIRAVSKIPIGLSRDVVVVPAYSFLRIDINLSQPHASQQDFIGRADFISDRAVDIQAKDFVIRVNVQWCHPYALKKNKVVKLSKRPKISSDRQEGSINREPSLRNYVGEEYSLLEVFTVMIGHNSQSELKIYGTMKVYDGWKNSVVFNRNELDPETLAANNETIPTEGPSRCFDASVALAMQLHLKDVEGRVLIRGTISWSTRNIDWPISWYDRRICSVIRGVHGYAAVFYTILSKAVQTVVQVSFVSKHYPDVSHRVHGTVVARYSNDLTKYEEAYYQSVLFKEPPENPSELNSGATLPLLKSVVALPTDASLTVGVNLYASSLLDELPEQNLKKDFRFDNVPNTPISQQFEGNSHRIEVTVYWVKLIRYDIK